MTRWQTQMRQSDSSWWQTAGRNRRWLLCALGVVEAAIVYVAAVHQACLRMQCFVDQRLDVSNFFWAVTDWHGMYRAVISNLVRDSQLGTVQSPQESFCTESVIGVALPNHRLHQGLTAWGVPPITETLSRRRTEESIRKAALEDADCDQHVQ